MYETILENAGDIVIMGCNTLSHLCAGLVHINRTGDDTSGREWERTRRLGVNTMAFRLCQNNRFYVADADCAGITPAVPWSYNKQWVRLLGRKRHTAVRFLQAGRHGRRADGVRRGNVPKERAPDRRP